MLAKNASAWPIAPELAALVSNSSASGPVISVLANHPRIRPGYCGRIAAICPAEISRAGITCVRHPASIQMRDIGYSPDRCIKAIAVETIFFSAHPGFRRDPIT